MIIDTISFMRGLTDEQLSFLYKLTQPQSGVWGKPDKHFKEGLFWAVDKEEKRRIQAEPMTSLTIPPTQSFDDRVRALIREELLAISKEQQ